MHMRASSKMSLVIWVKGKENLHYFASFLFCKSNIVSKLTVTPKLGVPRAGCRDHPSRERAACVGRAVRSRELQVQMRDWGPVRSQVSAKGSRSQQWGSGLVAFLLPAVGKHGKVLGCRQQWAGCHFSDHSGRSKAVRRAGLEGLLSQRQGRGCWHLASAPSTCRR